MAYKWKPSASQRRAFAEKMKDPNEQAAYNQRKVNAANKRRLGSRYDYSSAGGQYVPTQYQYDHAFKMVSRNDLSQQQIVACNIVMSGYICNERVHHDYIHIINEHIRSQSTL